jgi:hypothetical protein
MSDKFFYDKFNDALIDIIELYQEEQMPDTSVNNKRISDTWINRDWLNFYVPLYIKYIDVLKRVEDCYDQITNPQIRKMIKNFLENLIVRVCQIKKELIIYNNPIPDVQGISYIFFDDFLIDMKLEPEALNLPIPKYYLEDTEEIKIRNVTLNQRLIEKNGNALPEQDITKSFFNFEFNLEEAIKILQNFEVGRQNLKRVNKALKLAHKISDNEIGGENKIMNEDDRKKLIYEHLISYQKMKKAKEEEMKLLKMSPNNINELADVKTAVENRKNRKIVQSEKEIDYANYKKDLAKNIEVIEGYNLQQDLISHRRDWYEKEKSDTGKIPESIDGFYKRLEVDKNGPILDDAQKKVQEGLAKDKLKKEQDKKKKEEGNAVAIKCIIFIISSTFIWWSPKGSYRIN